MRTLHILAVVCFAGTFASELNKPYYEIEDAEVLFKDYLKEYKKRYNRFEYLERLEIFKKTLEDINSRNAKHPHTVFAVNRFADLREEEVREYKGFKPLNASIPAVTIPDSGVVAPDHLDWRDNGVVSHVKDQGQCGSCFIFSAIGSIEGQYAIKHSQCLAFSEGQALDCTDDGTCNGGWPHEIMLDLSQRAGLMLEQDYPYTPAKQACHEDASKVAGHVTSGARIDIPNEDALLQKLAEIGPLSVTLNANDFNFYQGGILYPDQCKGQEMDHAVLLVGYGEESGVKYWIIKNSWGTTWGEKGYVRLLRGVDACVMGTSYTANSEVQ